MVGISDLTSNKPTKVTNMFISEDELLNVPVPEKTESYSPVPHEQILDEIYTNADKAGLEVANKSFRVKRSGERVVGLMDINAGNDTFNYRLAFRNSYDKSMSVAFVGGTSVMICSNGMILGETKFIRKHTGAVNGELTDKIQRVIGDLDSALGTAEDQAEKMKNIEVDRRLAGELCGRLLMEQEIISLAQLRVIKDQINSPDHEEFAHPNLWSIYNHTTHALKKTAPEVYVSKYQELHNFVEDEFKLS